MISREEIQNLAQLSRLQLDEKEIAGLQKDFDSILEYIGQIKDAASGERRAAGKNQGRTLESPEQRSDLGFSELQNVMRADEPRAAGDPLYGKEDAILSQAPTREGDYFVVRKIIEREN